MEQVVANARKLELDYCNHGRAYTADFVVYDDRDFLAIEVKNVPKLDSKDFSGHKSFASDYPEARRSISVSFLCLSGFDASYARRFAPMYSFVAIRDMFILL